jgi:hypothetical protein
MSQAALFNPVRHNPAHADGNSTLSSASRQSGLAADIVRCQPGRVSLAAFQDRVWRPRLEPLRGLARLRIVHCVVTADVALRRVLQRGEDNPRRSVHVDPRSDRDLAGFVRQREAFDRVSVQAPWMEVDTTDGYQPGLDEIVRFVNGPG